jgi:hypothetical protein
MRKDEIDEILGNDDEPNEPKKTALIGGANGKRNVTKLHEDDAKKRKEEIATLLVNGATRDSICRIMGRSQFRGPDGRLIKGYAMSEHEVDVVIKSIYAEWEEEEAEYRRYAKNKSERRILAEITQARTDKQFGAVANLEKVLMAIQGTEQPPELPQQVDSRITDALLQFFGELDPKEMRVLIERERVEFFAGDKGAPQLPAATISTAHIKRKKRGE